jgi:hypothetical protein
MLDPCLGRPLPEQIAVVLPRPKGGVAPPRHEVALADYIEKQRAYRRPTPFSLNIARARTVWWALITGACLAAIRVIAHSKRAAKWMHISGRTT